jgi:hypothetical protein
MQKIPVRYSSRICLAFNITTKKLITKREKIRTKISCAPWMCAVNSRKVEIERRAVEIFRISRNPYQVS